MSDPREGARARSVALLVGSRTGCEAFLVRALSSVLYPSA